MSSGSLGVGYPWYQVCPPGRGHGAARNRRGKERRGAGHAGPGTEPRRAAAGRARRERGFPRAQRGAAWSEGRRPRGCASNRRGEAARPARPDPTPQRAFRRDRSRPLGEHRPRPSPNEGSDDERRSGFGGLQDGDRRAERGAGFHRRWLDGDRHRRWRFTGAGFGCPQAAARRPGSRRTRALGIGRRHRHDGRRRRRDDVRSFLVRRPGRPGARPRRFPAGRAPDDGRAAGGRPRCPARRGRACIDG